MATAETEAAEEAPAPKSRKKLIIIAAAAAAVLAAGGGGAYVYFSNKAKAEAEAAAAEAEEGDEDSEGKVKEEKPVARSKDFKPSFMALEPFVINLADKDGSRYAQIGIQLELNEDKSKDKVKSFEPIIRSNIIVLLARKTSTELLEHEGKMKLAREIRREVLRPLGYDLPESQGSAEAARIAAEHPVRGVHFSSFIIQ